MGPADRSRARLAVALAHAAVHRHELAPGGDEIELADDPEQLPPLVGVDVGVAALGLAQDARELAPVVDRQPPPMLAHHHHGLEGEDPGSELPSGYAWDSHRHWATRSGQAHARRPEPLDRRGDRLAGADRHVR